MLFTAKSKTYIDVNQPVDSTLLQENKVTFESVSTNIARRADLGYRQSFSNLSDREIYLREVSMQKRREVIVTAKLSFHNSLLCRQVLKVYFLRVSCQV